MDYAKQYGNGEGGSSILVFTALHVADERAVEPSLVRESFLRPAPS